MISLVLGRLQISTRLVLLVLLPAVGFLLLGGSLVSDRAARANSAAGLEADAKLASAVGLLIHGLQRERGSTSLFVSSRGASFRDELTQYRRDTDAASAAVTALVRSEAGDLDSGIRDGILAALDKVAGVRDARSSADRFSVAPAQLITQYTQLVAAARAALSPLVTSSSDAEQARRIAALLALIDAKEQAGIERAQLSNVLTKKIFAPGQRVRVAGLVASRESYLAVFRLLGGAPAQNAYDQLAQQPAMTAAARTEQQALADGASLTTPATTWFQQSTQRIDALMTLEDRFTSDLQASARRTGQQARTDLVIASIVVTAVLALTAVLAAAIIGSIRRPLRATVTVIQAFADGDLNVQVPDADGRCDISVMLRALRTAIVAQRETLTRIHTTAESLATAAHSLTEMSNELQGSSQVTARQAEKIRDSAEVMSDGVQSAAAATEQLNGSIHEISQGAARAAQVAGDAEHSAATAEVTMANLAESSAQVGAVIAQVQAIAEQTNLLALNASIEAARAGDAGRGFSVVAGEVKALAASTATASEDIAARVAAIQKDAGAAAADIAQITAVIESIAESQTTIAGAVEEQTAATQDISSHVAQAANASNGIAHRISDVADAAQATSAAVTRASAAADTCQHLADSLNKTLNRFRW